MKTDIHKNQLKDSTDQVKKLEETGRLKSVNIEFEHTVNQKKYTFPSKDK
mgnify:FL=1